LFSTGFNDYHFEIQMTSPHFSFGSQKRSGLGLKSDLDLPCVGPGSYDVPMIKRKEPAFSVMRRYNEQLPTYVQAPGAGAYSPPSKVSDPLVS
jgi:hypothetical protein